jgi:hypothetical protein
MHETGLRIKNEQVRDGEVIHSGNVEHWEFDQNGNAVVQQDVFVVKPGDSFRTTCYYEDFDGSRTFGLASSEEMCMAFLYYYPRQKFDFGGGVESGWFCGYNNPVPQCQSTYEKRTLVSKDELNREYAIPNTQCEVAAQPEEGDSGSSPALATTFGLAGVVGALGAMMMMA